MFAPDSADFNAIPLHFYDLSYKNCSPEEVLIHDRYSITGVVDYPIKDA